MFSLKTVVSILAVGPLTALAAPTADSGTNNKIVARQSSAIVNWCQHQDWRGACSTVYAAPGVCYDVPAEWLNHISSIQNLNKDVFKCTWYQRTGCGGEKYTSQEDGDLADGNGWWNDRISSYKCNRK